MLCSCVVKRSLRMLFLTILCFVVFVIVIQSTYLVVKIATTTYRAEWVGADGKPWYDKHAVAFGNEYQCFVRFSDYMTRNNDFYMIEMVTPANVVLNGENVSIKLDGNTILISMGYAKVDDGWFYYFATLPAEFSPRQEGESLEISFSLCKDGQPSSERFIKLEFKSKMVRHFFNIFRDIT